MMNSMTKVAKSCAVCVPKYQETERHTRNEHFTSQFAQKRSKKFQNITQRDDGVKNRDSGKIVVHSLVARCVSCSGAVKRFRAHSGINKGSGISKMAKELSLMAVPRTVLGKQVKALRREGLVPGVVYGPAVAETIQVSVNRRELEKFYVSYGHSALFTLNWETGSQQVFIKEVQVEPVRRAPLHVDFFAPNLKKELTSKVQVVLSHADEHAEGVLTQLVNEIEVRALP